MEIASSNKQMWRGALTPALICSALAIAISTINLGAPGFAGSALASLIVLIYFSVSIAIGILSRNSAPMAAMTWALLSYFTKLLLTALLLIAVTRLSQPESVNRSAFGISAIATALAWLTGEARAFLKLRLELPQPKKEQE
jgi:ATP synthase protein I